MNGHVYPQVDAQKWGTTWAQRPLLFHSSAGKFNMVPPVEKTGLAKVSPARGMAFGDLFNDGRIDVVINNMDSPPSLFRNVVKNDNHWIAFRLIGSQELSPRKRRSSIDAIGATIYVTAGGVRQRFDITAGGSFASSSDQRPHFGLGHSTKVDKVEISWPSGRNEQITVPLAVDRFYTIQEQKGVLNTPKDR